MQEISPQNWEKYYWSQETFVEKCSNGVSCECPHPNGQRTCVIELSESLSKFQIDSTASRGNFDDYSVVEPRDVE